jgi:hypothetical protein
VFIHRIVIVIIRVVLFGIMALIMLENLVSYISEYSPKPSFASVRLGMALGKQSSVSFCYHVTAM